MMTGQFHAEISICIQKGRTNDYNHYTAVYSNDVTFVCIDKCVTPSAITAWLGNLCNLLAFYVRLC